MIYDIETAKRMGFNMLRKHIKIEPLRWYYHCDRLGMLVWQDMVSCFERFHPLTMQVLPVRGDPAEGRSLREIRTRRAGRARAV